MEKGLLYNQFNHPSSQVLSRLVPAVIHRTDQQGTLEFQTDGTTELIRSWRPVTGWSALRELPTPSNQEGPQQQRPEI